MVSRPKYAQRLCKSYFQGVSSTVIPLLVPLYTNELDPEHKHKLMSEHCCRHVWRPFYQFQNQRLKENLTRGVLAHSENLEVKGIWGLLIDCSKSKTAKCYSSSWKPQGLFPTLNLTWGLYSSYVSFNKTQWYSLSWRGPMQIPLRCKHLILLMGFLWTNLCYRTFLQTDNRCNVWLW